MTPLTDPDGSGAAAPSYSAGAGDTRSSPRSTRSSTAPKMSADGEFPQTFLHIALTNTALYRDGWERR